MRSGVPPRGREADYPPAPAAVLAAPLGPLAAHSLTRVLPLAPSTVPKSTDRRLRRCSPGPSVLTLAPKFLHQTS